MPKTSIVMNPTAISGTFPRLPSSLVNRDHILETIDLIFNGNNNIAVIEGDEGTGKTILLAQYALKHADFTISLFIRPTPSREYDPDTVRFDICNQLEWIISNRELDPQTVVDDGYWRNKIIELKRRARFYRYYFIIDGLDDIPEKDTIIKEILLDLFSFEQKGFYFVFSGDPKKLFSDNRRWRLDYKAQYLTSFSPEEAKKYFRDFISDDACIEEINKICKGIPGYLAIVKRLWSSETSCQSLLENLPDKLPELFELEWKKAKINNEEIQKLLAIMAFDNNKHSVKDLARIADIDVETVRHYLKGLSFIEVDDADIANFVSEAFHKFVAKRLSDIKKITIDLIIEDYFKNPDDLASLTYLPDYLENAKQFDKLFDYLSLNRFTKMIERHQSLSIVIQKTNIGIRVAQQLHRDGDLMRFSIQKSAVIGLNGADILRSEIEALMSLDNYNSAIALAQDAVLKENRLYLLAVIAKARHEQNQPLEAIIISQIRQLYEDIDHTLLGERAIEIASNLIHVCPDLAIKLVEETTKIEDGESELDWALARLSLETFGKDTEQISSLDILESISTRIKNPAARQLSRAFSLISKEYSAVEVINATEKVDSIRDKLFLLDIWLIENSKKEDSLKVIDFALKLAIKGSPRPNARIFRTIATPLPFASGRDNIEMIINLFDSQMEALEHIGPTEDYIRLKLLLAQTTHKYDVNNAYDRTIDAYYHICYIEDLGVKIECMARLLITLSINHGKVLENKNDLYTIVEEEFHEYINVLLSTTSDHYELTKNIIRILTPNRCDLVLEIVNHLNTEDRRQYAILNFIKELSHVSIQKLDLPFIEGMLSNITNYELRE